MLAHLCWLHCNFEYCNRSAHSNGYAGWQAQVWYLDEAWSDLSNIELTTFSGAFNSLLIMRLFSPVIRRHKKNAIIQQYHPPSTMVPWQRWICDAVAAFQPHGGVCISTRMLAPSSDQTIQRSNTGATMTPQWRDSYSWEIGSTSGYTSVGQHWDKLSGITIESVTDTASIVGERACGSGHWSRMQVGLLPQHLRLLLHSLLQDQSTAIHSPMRKLFTEMESAEWRILDRHSTAKTRR